MLCCVAQHLRTRETGVFRLLCATPGIVALVHLSASAVDAARECVNLVIVSRNLSESLRGAHSRSVYVVSQSYR